MNAAIWASIVAAATPLIFATVGETITERAGVVNLSLDGSILLSALTAFATAQASGNLLLGFAAGAAVSATIAVIVAASSIVLRLDQIAIGFVASLLAGEASGFLGQGFVPEVGPTVQRLDVAGLSELPWVGQVFFSQNLLVYAGFVTIFSATVFLFSTRPGLELSAVGERPEAAHARGIAVHRQRLFYSGFGGALVGIGGAAFSLSTKAGWSDGHTTNFGWIALAIVIFGGWHPVRAAIGCYLFGGLQVAALELQDVSWLSELTQVLSALPFPLMILTLVLVNRRWFKELSERVPALRRVLAATPPGALGTAFHPE